MPESGNSDQMSDVRPVDEKQNVPDNDDQETREIFNEAFQRFEDLSGSELEKDNRDQANEDIRFVNEPGGMWDDYASDNWQGRPKFEVNQIQPMINVVIGSQRESDFTSRVIPLGSGATKKMADIFNGLVRSINTLSNFDDCRDNAFRESVTCGFGGWYVTTEWNESDPWIQDIVVKPIRSAVNSVYWDPGSTMECNEDANYCFVCEWMTETDFKAAYPDASPINMPINRDLSNSEYWFHDGKVRVADYWRKVPVKKMIGLFKRLVPHDEDESKMKLEEQTWEIDRKTGMILDEAAGEGWRLIKQREMHSYKIEHRKMCGSEFLEGPNEWAGKYIPVVPLYGYQTWLDGARRYWGMVRFAKDAARIYNYTWSSIIHILAKSPKDPYWITPKMLQNKNHAQALQNMAVNDNPFYMITPDPDVPGGLPARSGGPQFPQAMSGVLVEAQQNVQRVTGKFSSSQGDNEMDQSGRAVIALQRQGDLGTFSLIDNLAKSIRRHTEILIDLIPRIYDTERQVRITQSDGSTRLIQLAPDGTIDVGGETVTVNTEFNDEQTGEKVLVVDLNQGRYDVSEEVGASYSSKRQEAMTALQTMAQSNAQIGMLVMDEILKMMDFSGTEEAIKRVQKYMVNMGLREPTEEEIKEAQKKAQEAGPQQPSIEEQIALQKAQAELEKMALENDKLEIDNQSKQIEMQLKQLEAQIKQQESIGNAAKTEKTLAETEKTEAQTKQIVRETQTVDQG